MCIDIEASCNQFKEHKRLSKEQPDRLLRFFVILDAKLLLKKIPY